MTESLLYRLPGSSGRVLATFLLSLSLRSLPLRSNLLTESEIPTLSMPDFSQRRQNNAKPVSLGTDSGSGVQSSFWVNGHNKALCFSFQRKTYHVNKQTFLDHAHLILSLSKQSFFIFYIFSQSRRESFSQSRCHRSPRIYSRAAT